MKIEDILKRDCVIADLEADSKETALKIMAERLYELGYVKESYIQAIQEREASYPSGLPMGDVKIAIPHTDSQHVHKSVICFARTTQDMEFSVMGDPDQQIPVRLISMFALKEKKEIGNLLETLIVTYQDNDTLQALLNAKDEQEIYQLLYRHVGENMRGNKE